MPTILLWRPGALLGRLLASFRGRRLTGVFVWECMEHVLKPVFSNCCLLAINKKVDEKPVDTSEERFHESTYRNNHELFTHFRLISNLWNPLIDVPNHSTFAPAAQL